MHLNYGASLEDASFVCLPSSASYHPSATGGPLLQSRSPDTRMDEAAPPSASNHPCAAAAFVCLQRFLCSASASPDAAAADDDGPVAAATLPAPTLRRIAALWHRATLAAPHAAPDLLPRSAGMLAARLLELPPSEILPLPRRCVRWLWSQPERRVEKGGRQRRARGWGWGWG